MIVVFCMSGSAFRVSVSLSADPQQTCLSLTSFGHLHACNGDLRGGLGRCTQDNSCGHGDSKNNTLFLEAEASVAVAVVVAVADILSSARPPPHNQVGRHKREACEGTDRTQHDAYCVMLMVLVALEAARLWRSYPNLSLLCPSPPSTLVMASWGPTPRPLTCTSLTTAELPTGLLLPLPLPLPPLILLRLLLLAEPLSAPLCEGNADVALQTQRGPSSRHSFSAMSQELAHSARVAMLFADDAVESFEQTRSEAKKLLPEKPSPSGSCISGLCIIPGMRMSGICMSGICMSGMCISGMCTSEMCMPGMFMFDM